MLRTGKLLPLWVDSDSGKEDDGVFAFARASDDGESFVVVVVNASDTKHVTSDGFHVIRLSPDIESAGKVLRPVLTIGPGEPLPIQEYAADGPLSLPVPASGLVVYEGFLAK